MILRHIINKVNYFTSDKVKMVELEYPCILNDKNFNNTCNTDKLILFFIAIDQLYKHLDKNKTVLMRFYAFNETTLIA